MPLVVTRDAVDFINTGLLARIAQILRFTIPRFLAGMRIAALDTAGDVLLFSIQCK